MHACLALSIGATTHAAMPNDEWVMCSCRYSIASEVCLHMHSAIIHSATFVHVASYHWDTHAKCRVIVTGIGETNDQYAWHTTFPAMCIATLWRTGKRDST